MRAAAGEIRTWLEHLNLNEEVAKALAKMVIEVKTEIRFRPNEDGKLVSETSNDVKVKGRDSSPSRGERRWSQLAISSLRPRWREAAEIALVVLSIAASVDGSRRPLRPKRCQALPARAAQERRRSSPGDAALRRAQGSF